MDREKVLGNKTEIKVFSEIVDLHTALSKAFSSQFNRSIPFCEEVFDRWERANNLGFGDKTSIYDSSFVFGDVEVGENTWIGPFTIIDGSGGLKIGNGCTISAGVHIYTHDNLAKTILGGEAEIDKAPVVIGDNSYIAPHCIVSKGVRIGNQCVLAANSFLNQNMPDRTIFGGNPAKLIGTVVVKENTIELKFH